jgi:hypothetical protein
MVVVHGGSDCGSKMANIPVRTTRETLEIKYYFTHKASASGPTLHGLVFTEEKITAKVVSCSTGVPLCSTAV